MKIENKVNIEIPYTTVFNEKFIIDDKYNFLLSSIKIYEVNGSRVGKEVDFEIKVIGSKRIIYPLSIHDKFMIIAERIMQLY